MGKSKFIIISGADGAGKSTLSRDLLKRLPNSVLLDLDWLWMMNPCIASKDIEEVVMDNATNLVKSYVLSKKWQYIIFCWSYYSDEKFQQILNPIKNEDLDIIKINLISSKEKLLERLQDTPRIIECVSIKSVDRCEEFVKMDTLKIDVDDKTADEVFNEVRKVFTWVNI